MQKKVYESKYFDIKSTLECGQVFRFKQYNKGYLVFSGNHCCYAYTDGSSTYLESENIDYFNNYFDLDNDYERFVLSAEKEGVDILTTSANLGKGIRILNQDIEETLFSFIISQNNHIPRIKAIIERLCENLGQERLAFGQKYYTFPSAEIIASKDKSFYTSIGLGYRDAYMVEVASKIVNGFSLESLRQLSTVDLKKNLLKLKGVGPKVADCVTLFGFHRFDSFPVDTWIDKVYRENFKGTITDRKLITEYFLNRFGDRSGIYQQYLFYYKRTLEEK